MPKGHYERKKRNDPDLGHSSEGNVASGGEQTELSFVLGEITQKLDKIFEILNHLLKSSTLDRKIEELTPNVVIPEASKNPVPLEYRMLVDETLNKAFEVEVEGKSDLPVFEFTIYVPKKYSNAPAGHWQMYQNDKRTKVIPYSDGINGVRQFCELVFNNFSQETKGLIVQDRVMAQ